MNPSPCILRSGLQGGERRGDDVPHLADEQIPAAFPPGARIAPGTYPEGRPVSCVAEACPLTATGWAASYSTSMWRTPSPDPTKMYVTVMESQEVSSSPDAS